MPGPDPIDEISKIFGVKWGKPKMPGNRPAGGGSGLKMPDFGKGVADALNTAGRAARGATQAREAMTSPRRTAAAGKRAPARRNTSKYR